MEDPFGWEQVTDSILIEHLERLFPNAGHHEWMHHNNDVYMRHYKPSVKYGNVARPCGKLGGGKVSKWEYHWEIRRKVSEFGSIEAKLEHYFPQARSRDEVVFEGKRYRRRFYPIFSQTKKTIHRWDRDWEYLGPAVNDTGGDTPISNR